MKKSVVGPPYRPRYRVSSCTGYSAGGSGTSWREGPRKPITTWQIHDGLAGTLAGSAFEFWSEGEAEFERAVLECEWEERLREAGYEL